LDSPFRLARRPPRLLLLLKPLLPGCHVRHGFRHECCLCCFVQGIHAPMYDAQQQLHL
jgi:hypothetical protein